MEAVDLRRRKEEEQKKIADKSSGRKKEIWDRNGRRIRYRRFMEDLEYKDKVTYFISNLPHGCKWRAVWDEFQHFHNLVDVFIPDKKDSWGRTFGFLRFVDVPDPLVFLEKLSGVEVDGRKIRIGVSKRGREEASGGSVKGHWRPAVSKCVGPSDQPSQSSSGIVADLSFKEAASASLHPRVLKLDSKMPSVHPLMLSSLVGEVHSLSILDNLDFYMSTKNAPAGCEVRYLGGLAVLLSFPNASKAAEYLACTVKGWKSIFSSLKIWDGLPTAFERVAWVSIVGVPPHLFDGKILDLIGDACGRKIQDSALSSLDSNLAKASCPVITRSKKKIDMEVKIAHNNKVFSCWVHEDDDYWTPGFLSRPFSSDSLPSDGGAPPLPEVHRISCVGATVVSPPEYDQIFEKSMVGRLEENNGNDLMVAADFFSLFPMNDNDCFSLNGDSESACPNTSFDDDEPWANEDPSSILGLGSKANAGNMGLHPNSEQNITNILGDCDGLGPGNVSDNQDCSSDGSGNSKDVSSDCSDPFGLGPIIKHVMEQEKRKKSSIEEEEGMPAIPNLGLGKQRRRLQRVPDLNLSYSDLSRFKISRILMGMGKRRKKRGCNKIGTSSSSSSSSSSPEVFATPVDSCGRASGQLGGNSQSHEEEASLRFVDSVKDHIDSHGEGIEDGIVDAPEHPYVSELQKEVDDTILVNSMVGIDLVGLDRDIEGLIRDEGAFSGYP
ncbi:hypothetical protein QVD17_38498 [Tagetes erecta]|uniref:RRM domain-containing protein n=1 Tax=Tagetes erecta TaxID=13708 RepID=A0AAD8JP03_TARER|nr:hypothetical protein QVD17_38498 [Tagetes erecta]